MLPDDVNGYCVVKFDNGNVYAIYGPYPTRAAAEEYARGEAEMKAVVMPLWKED